MIESTLLSQYFAEQGLKIRIRKEVRPKKRSRGDYLPAPSQSPPDSQMEQVDPSDEQDEDAKTPSSTGGASTSSKRRASGTKNAESRRGDMLLHTVDQEQVIMRPRGSFGTEMDDERVPSKNVDRLESSQEVYPSVNYSDGSLVSRRSSASVRLGEHALYMDPAQGGHAPGRHQQEPRMDEARVGPMDVTMEHHSGREQHSMTGHPAPNRPLTANHGYAVAPRTSPSQNFRDWPMATPSETYRSSPPLLNASMYRRVSDYSSEIHKTRPSHSSPPQPLHQPPRPMSPSVAATGAPLPPDSYGYHPDTPHTTASGSSMPASAYVSYTKGGNTNAAAPAWTRPRTYCPTTSSTVFGIWGSPSTASAPAPTAATPKLGHSSASTVAIQN
ncbi:hypothetical protein BGW38_005849 [Lunasporangiospora selenospora]|uniref:Velvet domain-containing protein n=1 Tax=Lunasporangiospora selenospora TaxID=979761 RepID=A0A9P6FMW4_9FUNG|nr:hypothetical protein BGW38_005849 [Lunasporangiospora selenospora]